MNANDIALEAARSICNYCSTRFPDGKGESQVFAQLDEPWFAERVKKAIDKATLDLCDRNRVGGQMQERCEELAAENKCLRAQLEGKGKPMQTFRECVEQAQRNGPTANHEFYRPQESPTRYPLELGPEGNICLWEPQGRHKITIAYLYADKEGDFDLCFVGDRPLDKRVNWDHFRECVEQGFALMRGKR